MVNNPNLEGGAEIRNGRLMNNVERYPLLVGAAQGSTLYNEGCADKKKWMHAEPMPYGLLDYWGDEGVCSLGYNSPEVFRAIHKFLGTGYPHQLPDIYPHPLRYQLADMLCERTGMDRVFLANSGTEANESAIKIARKYWWDRGKHTKYDDKVAERHIIFTIEGNFHGRTGLSLAAGDFRVSPYHRWGFGPLPEGFAVLTADPDWTRPVFKQVVSNGEEHEPVEPDWESAAAIILAPVLGNNCVRTYPQAFFDELMYIRQKYGVLLIFDDVQAGSGRAGAYATWQHYNVKPDIMTLAKGMAMGFPMSAMLATEKVARTFTPGVHFNTFGGSPFVCHMAIEMLRWLDDHMEEINEKGKFIREWLASLDDCIGAVDGIGMLNAFTPVWDELPFDGFQLIREARKHGLSMATHRASGPVRFTPPLNVAMEEINTAIDKLHKSMCVLKGES